MTSLDSDSRLADELLTAMSAVRRATRRRDGRPAELSSLTRAQLELARVVRGNPGISIAAAADAMRLAPNTVSTLVGELTALRILVRTTDAADRRVARLELSGDWKRTVDAWRDRRLAAVAEAIARLPAAERRRVEQALPALARIANELEPLATAAAA
ncbi:MAG TPA: MarR family transcriptional regulator [Gaiellaceae bacterium]|nr:MarR family transcriptional regulator [Gaiellaceae bacterium]